MDFDWGKVAKSKKTFQTRKIAKYHKNPLE